MQPLWKGLSPKSSLYETRESAPLAGLTDICVVIVIVPLYMCRCAIRLSASTSNDRQTPGRVPRGRRPIEGGYEQNGAQLYHAYGTIECVDVPGKTDEHLGGANVAFGGREHDI